MNKIEGGPECDYKACAEMICKDGQSYHIVGKVYFGECPKCKGTGVKPLSEWTDAEKIEKLLEWSCRDSSLGRGKIQIVKRRVQRSKKKVWRYFVETFPQFTYPEPEGETSSAALTAAVECVAKEIHGPPKRDNEV